MADNKSGDHYAWHVAGMIEAARNGAHDDAREVLRTFVSAVTHSHYRADDPEAQLLAYVAGCLRQYLEQGAGLELAFGVKRPKQRPKGASGIVEQSIARAAAVELLTRHGFDKTPAVEAVAEATGRDRRTIMRDCEGWVEGSLPEHYLRHIALPVTRSPNFPPLPAA